MSDEGLIDGREYAWLCSEAPNVSGGGSPSPRRLETYDEHEARLVAAEAALAEAQRELDIANGMIDMAVARLGGEVEGRPTARLNFLQRVDELVAVEIAYSLLPTARDGLINKLAADLAAHRQQVRAFAEVIRPVIEERHWHMLRKKNTLWGGNESWEHNAGPGWPDVDDDSFEALENCVHPTCKAVREALSLTADVPPQEGT